jgi:hypothetical protein
MQDSLELEETFSPWRRPMPVNVTRERIKDHARYVFRARRISVEEHGLGLIRVRVKMFWPRWLLWRFGPERLNQWAKDSMMSLRPVHTRLEIVLRPSLWPF